MLNRSGRQVFFLSLLISCCLVVFAGRGNAAAPKLVDVSRLGDPALPGSPTTYLDLLKLVFSDLHLTEKGFEAMASKTAPIRHIEGEYTDTSFQGDITFNSFTLLTIHSQKRPLLLISVDITIKRNGEGDAEAGEYSLLALFKNGSPPQLLDVLDIRADHLNGFWSDNPVIELNPDNDGVLVFNNHFNSNQSYTIVRMLFVSENRLQEICNVFSFDYRTECETYRSHPAFSVVPDSRQVFPKVVAAVTIHMAPSPLDCHPRRPGYKKTYRAVFQWDKSKHQYGLTSNNLDKLMKFYEKYF